MWNKVLDVLFHEMLQAKLISVGWEVNATPRCQGHIFDVWNMKCILLSQRDMCDFLCLVINVCIYFALLEETKSRGGECCEYFRKPVVQ